MPAIALAPRSVCAAAAATFLSGREPSADRQETRSTPADPGTDRMREPAGDLMIRVALGAPHEAGNERYDEEDDEDPEEQPRRLHGKAGDAAEADGGSDQRHDQEHQRVVEKVAHVSSPVIRLLSRPLGVTAPNCAAPACSKTPGRAGEFRCVPRFRGANPSSAR